MVVTKPNHDESIVADRPPAPPIPIPMQLQRQSRPMYDLGKAADKNRNTSS